MRVRRVGRSAESRKSWCEMVRRVGSTYSSMGRWGSSRVSVAGAQAVEGTERVINRSRG